MRLKATVGKTRNRLGKKRCALCPNIISTSRVYTLKLDKTRPIMHYVCKSCYLRNSDRKITVWKYDLQLKDILWFKYSRKKAVIIKKGINLEIPREIINSLKELKLFPKSYFVYTNTKEVEKQIDVGVD